MITLWASDIKKARLFIKNFLWKTAKYGLGSGSGSGTGTETLSKVETGTGTGVNSFGSTMLLTMRSGSKGVVLFSTTTNKHGLLYLAFPVLPIYPNVKLTSSSSCSSWWQPIRAPSKTWPWRQSSKITLAGCRAPWGLWSTPSIVLYRTRCRTGSWSRVRK